MNKKKHALISVFNKDGIVELCKIFINHQIEIIATESTAKHISSYGIACKTISNITKFNELLDGRVKTLHPKIHASLLFNRKNRKHLNMFKRLNFPIIDFVVVNIYPFEN